MQDEIIRVLFDFASKRLYPSLNPSEGERMSVVATGGYGRGLLAPGSDIDLLFVLPYKQTAWGESIAEAILYCLWDMGLKVGHATRSVDECIRQAKARHDHPHRHPRSRVSCMATARCSTNWSQRFDKDVVQGTATEFVAAKLAEREDRLRRNGSIALHRRAQRQGRQRRTARPAHACSGSANTFIASALSRNWSITACSIRTN